MKYVITNTVGFQFEVKQVLKRRNICDGIVCFIGFSYQLLNKILLLVVSNISFREGFSWKLQSIKVSSDCSFKGFPLPKWIVCGKVAANLPQIFGKLISLPENFRTCLPIFASSSELLVNLFYFAKSLPDTQLCLQLLRQKWQTFGKHLKICQKFITNISPFFSVFFTSWACQSFTRNKTYTISYTHSAQI